jgi:hypothetical protein
MRTIDHAGNFTWHTNDIKSGAECKIFYKKCAASIEGKWKRTAASIGVENLPKSLSKMTKSYNKH